MKRAFIFGVILLLTMLYIKIGVVIKKPPVVKYETVKSSKETEKAITRAPTSDESIFGKYYKKFLLDSSQGNVII